jgi:hypothetical protein
MPDEMFCTLQFAVQQTFTSTTGSSSVQDFRGSDCYDPDATGVGTQPSWFDALMTIYSRGCVRASRIVVNCKALTSAAPGTMIVAPINDQAELDASLLTNPMAAEAMMSLNQPQFTFDMTMNWSDMIGERNFDNVRSSLNHWFTSAASPVSHNWFWRLAFRATDGTSTSVMYADVRIYYDVVFFRRNVSDEDFARIHKTPSNVSHSDQKLHEGDRKTTEQDFELIDQQDNVIARLHQVPAGSGQQTDARVGRPAGGSQSQRSYGSTIRSQSNK